MSCRAKLMSKFFLALLVCTLLQVWGADCGFENEKLNLMQFKHYLINCILIDLHFRKIATKNILIFVFFLDITIFS
jgi:hypothetical protein